MGMQSEIAIETALKPIFYALEEELSRAHGKERESLLRVTGVALKQFEWATPPWARPFIALTETDPS